MFGFLAQLLAWCYDVVRSYGGAISLFTVIVFVAITPLTVKGMRSMAEMARLQPELKRLQDQYRNDRVKLNEEMMALYKEHGVNPLGGCLPNILPFPVLIIIFEMLRHLTDRHNHQIFDPRRVLNGLPTPRYLSHASPLYLHLVRDSGRMISFGMDLGKSARDVHGFGAAFPFYALIAIMTVSQYIQQQQMTKKNPQSVANPQMKMTMQLFPAIYAVISLTLPASVVLYLLVSGLFRMAQNTISYRYDPKLKLALSPISAGGGTSGGDKKVIPAKATPAPSVESKTTTKAQPRTGAGVAVAPKASTGDAGGTSAAGAEEKPARRFSLAAALGARPAAAGERAEPDAGKPTRDHGVGTQAARVPPARVPSAPVRGSGAPGGGPRGTTGRSGGRATPKGSKRRRSRRGR